MAKAVLGVKSFKGNVTGAAFSSPVGCRARLVSLDEVEVRRQQQSYSRKLGDANGVTSVSTCRIPEHLACIGAAVLEYEIAGGSGMIGGSRIGSGYKRGCGVGDQPVSKS